MSLEFEFNKIEDARMFGKNVSRNLKATSVHERRGSKHFIVIPEKNLNKLAASTLAVSIVAAGLISGQQYLDEHKFGMVIDAMQRANPQLANLTEPQIGEYLSNLAPEQMQGVISNTKGVYHEMLYVDTYNNSSLEGEAALHPDLNNPGADVTFTTDGEVIREVQLKATDSTSYVNEHLEKYPDIEVLATQEAADKMFSVESSGFSNAEIENDVVSSFEELESSADAVDIASEAVSATVVSDEITGLGPISIITGLLFGIF
jgi:hypothetical protein